VAAGAMPSQGAKCFSVGHRVMSRPISPTTVRAASMPSIRMSRPREAMQVPTLSKRGSSP
jgi:hypothetical protein